MWVDIPVEERKCQIKKEKEHGKRRESRKVIRAMKKLNKGIRTTERPA